MPKVLKEVPKKRRKSNNPHFEWWSKQYESIIGEPYKTLNGGREAGHLAKIVKEFGEEEYAKVALLYLTGTGDDYLDSLDNGDKTICVRRGKIP